MSYRVRIMPPAKAELKLIGKYIAQDNPFRAITFVDEIVTSFTNTLSVFPHSAKLTSDLGLDEEIRMLPFKNYKCYYHVIEDKKIIEVLYVFNARKDTDSFSTGA